jgi:hypothetical protein
MYSLRLQMQRNRRMLSRLAMAGAVGFAALIALLPAGGNYRAGESQSAGTPDLYLSPTPVSGEVFGAGLRWPSALDVEETATLG